MLDSRVTPSTSSRIYLHLLDDVASSPKEALDTFKSTMALLQVCGRAYMCAGYYRRSTEHCSRYEGSEPQRSRSAYSAIPILSPLF